MKKTLFAVLAAIAGAAYFLQPGGPETALPGTPQAPVSSTASALARAFDEQRSNVQVVADGVVLQTLADDDQGSRHQRFIVAMPDGQTVLVAHNIDLAARVEALQVGDPVSVHGEYEWNAKGGVIHWTHDDPRGAHTAGWIKHRGRTYQ
jgi:hypothetical protein